MAAHYARPDPWVQETKEEYERRSAIGNQGHGRPDPVAARTGVPTMWVFEPHIAEAILRQMADEAGVVRHGERLDLAGNGVQTRNATSHQFKVKVDPYVVPGDPGSGLLPGIHDGGAGDEGSGDRRVQAYNYRMTLTDVPANRLPIPRPDGYDPRRYELLRRYVEAGVFDALDLNSPMPNRKTDVNNNGAFSSDHVGGNYDYPDADGPTRERIVRDHSRT